MPILGLIVGELKNEGLYSSKDIFSKWWGKASAHKLNSSAIYNVSSSVKLPPICTKVGLNNRSAGRVQFVAKRGAIFVETCGKLLHLLPGEEEQKRNVVIGYLNEPYNSFPSGSIICIRSTNLATYYFINPGVFFDANTNSLLLNKNLQYPRDLLAIPINGASNLHIYIDIACKIYNVLANQIHGFRYDGVSAIIAGFYAHYNFLTANFLDTKVFIKTKHLITQDQLAVFFRLLQQLFTLNDSDVFRKDFLLEANSEIKKLITKISPQITLDSLEYLYLLVLLFSIYISLNVAILTENYQETANSFLLQEKMYSFQQDLIKDLSQYRGFFLKHGLTTPVLKCFSIFTQKISQPDIIENVNLNLELVKHLLSFWYQFLSDIHLALPDYSYMSFQEKSNSQKLKFIKYPKEHLFQQIS